MDKTVLILVLDKATHAFVYQRRVMTSRAVRQCVCHIVRGSFVLVTHRKQYLVLFSFICGCFSWLKGSQKFTFK